MFAKWKASRARKAVIEGAEKLEKMTVKDIMTSTAISIVPDDTVIHAATKMVAEDISCLAVMTHGELKGIFSERDFLTKVPLNKKVFDMKVSDIMTPDVVTVKPEMSITDAMAVMKKHNFRRLVVEHDGGYGLITQTDYSDLIVKTFPVFPLNKALNIESIMSKKVLTATSKESFTKARDKMKRKNVGSILIMEKGMPLGIFTEYDVVMQFYDQEGKLDLKNLEAYMRKYVRAAPGEMSLFDAVRLLKDKRMRRLPVVEGEKVVGIVTQTDLVRFVFTNLKKIAAIAKSADEFGTLKKEYTGEFVGDHLKVY